METGTCRLCGQERPLLRASHLIPSSLYRHMKPGSALFGLASDLPAAGAFRPTYAAEPVVGELLCAVCDNSLLGRLDFYGHHVLVERLPAATRNGSDLVVAPISYGPLKLFLWSVLWRAAVSGDRRFRALADALPLEDLRRRLLVGDPGEPDLYPVAVALDDRPADQVLSAIALPPASPSPVTLVAGRYRFIWSQDGGLTRESLRVQAGPVPLVRSRGIA